MIIVHPSGVKAENTAAEIQAVIDENNKRIVAIQIENAEFQNMKTQIVNS